MKSHDSEQRLTQKCRDLNAEVVTNSAKVQSAMKISEEDKNSIASLRKDIEKAWKMVDIAHEKEQRAKETIQTLRIEINNLSKLIEQGTGRFFRFIRFLSHSFSMFSGVTVHQEKDVNDLTKIRDELIGERDQLLTDITQTRRDLDDNALKQTDLERQIREGNDQVANLQEKINNARTDNLRETKRRVSHSSSLPFLSSSEFLRNKFNRN